MDTEPTEEEMRRAREVAHAFMSTRYPGRFRCKEIHFDWCNAMTNAIATYAAERVRAERERGRCASCRRCGGTVTISPGSISCDQCGSRPFGSMPNICDNDVHANGGPHAGKCLCGGNVFHPSGARRSAHAYAWHYELCNPTDSQPHSRACDALATMFGEPGPRPCVAIGSVPVPGQEEGKVPASSPQAAHQEKAREPVCRGQERERKIIVDYLRERFAIELADDVEHGEHVLAIKAEAIERDADLESDGGLRYCKPR